VIPKAVYGARSDTPTLTFWNLFVCPQSLPEEAAYALTKATFENLATLRQAVAAARDTSLENAVRFVGGTIPYHEGALRYFREAGALK
ncbi:MAG: TAXI family TRAP transporter solute-binding subunit, partial [Thermus sp.]